MDPGLFYSPGIWLGAILIGYCFGCLDMAWLLAFYKGLDIKALGNGNAGASNALMTLGIKSGMLTAIWDIGKAIMACALTYHVLGGIWYAGVLAAGMAIIGHCFPFWLDFDGGKGFAPFIGFMLCLDWKLAAAVLAVGFLLCILADRIVIMTFFCALLWPIAIYIRFDWRWSLVCMAVSVLIFWRHTDNIRNLINGSEPGIRAVLQKKR